MRGARLLPRGTVELALDGGYGQGDALHLGAPVSVATGGASVVVAPLGHFNVGLRVPDARSSITDSAGVQLLSSYWTPSLDLIGGADVGRQVQVAGFAEGRLPALGPVEPRFAAGASATWNGPVRLDASLGWFAADDALDASALARAATGAYAMDRLEFGACATIPVGDASFFLAYDGTIWAATLTVSTGGVMSANGTGGGYNNEYYGPLTYGGGSGGSVFMRGASVTLGTNLVMATPGYIAGPGRIRVDSLGGSGTTNPDYAAGFSQRPALQTLTVDTTGSNNIFGATLAAVVAQADGGSIDFAVSGDGPNQAVSFVSGLPGANQSGIGTDLRWRALFTPTSSAPLRLFGVVWSYRTQ